MFETGNEIPQDYSAAFEFFKKAVEERNLGVEFKLCTYLYDGKGTAKDEPAALKLCRKAVNERYLPAMLWLAARYEIGAGNMRDSKEAVRLYKQAAESGSGEAVMKLGSLYKTGGLVNKDESAAYTWFLIALNWHLPEARAEVDTMSAQFSDKDKTKYANAAKKWLEDSFYSAHHRGPRP